MLVIQDISGRAAELSVARKLAYHDRVTDLPNREFLLDELQQVVNRQRLLEGRLAVICLHIGSADELGYALSVVQQDKLLKALADQLLERLRGTNASLDADLDRVSIVARSDYRQFTVLLPNVADGADAEAVTLRLLDMLAEPLTVDGRTVLISPRAGVALFPQDGNDADSLFSNALVAMDDARLSPSSSYRLYSGTVRMRALQRQDLACELRTALDQDQFSVEFLPVSETSSDQCVSVEALLRWPAALTGEQNTTKIVAIAEHTGLILDIGQHVFDAGLRAFATWYARFSATVRLSFNVSLQEFSQPDFARRVSDILASQNIATRQIDLEIKQQRMKSDSANGFEACKALAKLGVRVVLDDFARAPYSLQMLANSSVAGLKVDRGVVAELAGDSSAQRACAAAMAVATELDLPIIACGVETAEQSHKLADLGFVLQQGFYFSHALTTEQVCAMLSENRSATQAQESPDDA